MWVCFNNAFVSAVENRNDKSQLVVRARRREHLEELFPDENIIEAGSTDYNWRVFVPKEKFAELVKQHILDINYDNFKNSVADHDLHMLYARFWNLHYQFQKYS